MEKDATESPTVEGCMSVATVTSIATVQDSKATVQDSKATAKQDMALSPAAQDCPSVDMTTAAQETRKTHRTTTFFDLPPELRNRIYELRVVNDDSDPITFYVRREKRNGQFEKKWMAFRLAKGWSSSILLINRQITREVEAVLYGKNAFSFDAIANLRDFLHMIGPQRIQYLRHVQVRSHDGYTRWAAKSTFTTLGTAKGLRKLEFRHDVFCKRSTSRTKHKLALEQVAKDLGPLFKSLHQSYQELRLNANVWDVLDLSAYRCVFDCSKNGYKNYHTMSCGCKCTDVEAKSKQLLADLHQLIATHLGITLPKTTEGPSR